MKEEKKKINKKKGSKKKHTTKKKVNKDFYIKKVKQYNTPLTSQQKDKFADMIHTMPTNDIVELIANHYGTKEERKLLISELVVRNLE